MKLSTLLVTGSLAVNAALFAVYLVRSHAVPATAAASGAALAGSGSTGDGKMPGAGKGAVADVAAKAGGKTWALLNTGDLRTLVARLRAAGFPPAVVRSIVAQEIAENFRARREALRPSSADQPFWKTETPFRDYDPKFFAAMRDLAREQSKLAKDVLGDDLNAGDTAISDNQRRRYGNIPAEKIEQLQRLDQDYNDLRNEVNMAARGIMLPEDRQKLAMLEQEKRADLAQVLSPGEMEDYLMRISPTTARLRPALTTFNATESEFKAIYQAQLPFDEKYNPQNMGGGYMPELMKERQSEQERTNDQIKAALGDQRYADYARASDREFQQLNRLAQQASLPDTAAVQVYNLREDTLKESGRIFEDADLSGEQKRAALQALGQNARAQIASTLGDEVGASYLKVAQRWLGALDRGGAVTLNPGGGMNTRIVPVQRRPQNPASAPATVPVK